MKFRLFILSVSIRAMSVGTILARKTKSAMLQS